MQNSLNGKEISRVGQELRDGGKIRRRAGAAVVASATFDAATLEAVVSFTESTDAALADYQVRAVPGPDYDGDDEVVLATLPPGAARTYRANYSLTAPGTAVTFKVYVVLTTGHEAGSNAVTVERP